MDEQQPQCPPMSLRDWFAGMALQGILAGAGPNDGAKFADTYKAACVGCYVIADAMMEARNK